MKNLIIILPIFLLVGCSQNFYQYQKDLRIIAKKEYDDNACEYTILGKDDYNFVERMKIVMPNNFGNVGDFVTITNGLQAWPK